MLSIYLDNCCFNRPYDDLSFMSIRLESDAKLFIQDLVNNGIIKLHWSYILEYENSRNPDIEISLEIKKWKLKSEPIITENHEILFVANNLRKHGISIKDSLHISCAIYNKVDFFITTDKGILKKRDLITDIKIKNPIEFVQFWEEEYENR